MTLEKLEKIINNLRKYDLIGEINDIRKWIISLNEKQINNFVCLNIKINNYLHNNKYLIIDSTMLNSDYYIEDLNIISKINNKVTINALLNVIFDGDAKKSLYYSKSKFLLAKQEDDIIIFCLKNLMTNSIFIQKPYQYELLELLSKQEGYHAYIVYSIIISTLHLGYDDVIKIINNYNSLPEDLDIKIYDNSAIKKNNKSKNEDDIHEMMYKIDAYKDEYEGDISKLIIK